MANSPHSDDEDSSSSSSSQPDNDASSSFSSSSFDINATRRRLEALMVSSSNNEEEEAAVPTPSKQPSSSATTTTPLKGVASLFSHLSFLFSSKPQQQTQTPNQEFSSKSNNENDSKSSNTNNMDLSFLDESLQQVFRRTTAQQQQPPLTAIEIERCELEIDLLNELQYSDESVEDLWTLWYQERGVQGANNLMKVDQFMTTPVTWKDAEVTLMDMVILEFNGDDDAIWVEPLNRLATLYYMQGRLRESQLLCEIVLDQKPWQFGALSGIVMVHAALNQPLEARKWAALRMPTLGLPPTSQLEQSQTSTNSRRQVWVQTAVEAAQARLSRRLKQGKSWWGPKDQNNKQTKNTIMNVDLDENAWQ